MFYRVSRLSASIPAFCKQFSGQKTKTTLLQFLCSQDFRRELSSVFEMPSRKIWLPDYYTKGIYNGKGLSHYTVVGAFYLPRWQGNCLSGQFSGPWEPFWKTSQSCSSHPSCNFCRNPVPFTESLSFENTYCGSHSCSDKITFHHRIEKRQRWGQH